MLKIPSDKNITDIKDKMPSNKDTMDIKDKILSDKNIMDIEEGGCGSDKVFSVPPNLGKETDI